MGRFGWYSILKFIHFYIHCTSLFECFYKYDKLTVDHDNKVVASAVAP